MELREYVGEKVRVVNTDGVKFEGNVSDYIYPEDNVPEEIEAVIIDDLVREDGYEYTNPVEFTSSEIKSIEIIQ